MLRSWEAGFTVSFLRELQGQVHPCPAQEWELAPYAKPLGAQQEEGGHTGTFLMMTVKHQDSHDVMEGVETERSTRTQNLASQVG